MAHTPTAGSFGFSLSAGKRHLCLAGRDLLGLEGCSGDDLPAPISLGALAGGSDGGAGKRGLHPAAGTSELAEPSFYVPEFLKLSQPPIK
jgi:hypothetical protein